MAKKFEYQVFTADKLLSGRDRIEERFIQLGQDGWELVGVNPNVSSSSQFIFKREIESPLTHKQERNGYEMSR